jgi:hypothetical protein
MHDRAEKKYTLQNMYMIIPVIILSTLTGTASVGIGSIAGDDQAVQKYLNFGIGGLNLIAAILTTLNNFLRFAQLGESNRVAGIAWGKFQRLIAVELALNPNDRMDSLDFLKICRADLDRLIEQSPPIPDSIIAEFEIEFKDKPKLRRPDICHGLDHTHVFDSSKSRLKDLTSEAALMLMHKKKMLRQEIIPDLDRMISNAVKSNFEKRQKDIEDLMKTNMPKDQQAYYKAAEADFRVLIDQRKKALEATKGLSKVIGTESFEITNPLRSLSSAGALANVKQRVIAQENSDIVVSIPEANTMVSAEEIAVEVPKKIETVVVPEDSTATTQEVKTEE